MSIPAISLHPTVLTLVAQIISQKDRDWLLLRSFFLVGELGSYYAAVEPLGLTEPSAVQKRVKKLSSALGVKLVATGDREGTPLTPEGWAVWELLKPEFAPHHPR